MIRCRSYLLIFLFVFFWACTTVGPDYERPELETKTAWRGNSASQLSPAEVIQADWWTTFEDPFLDKLVADAIAGSYDLKILLGRIREAGANLKETRADRLPTVGLSTSGDLTHGEGQGEESGSTENYALRSELSWEADIWGKKKRAYLATKAGYQAREADYRAGYIKLVAEVAQAYFQLRQKNRESSISNKFYKENQLILTIYENQHKAGIVPYDKVLRQKAQVSELKQNLSELERASTILENRINTLLGKPAGKMAFPADQMNADSKMVDVPVGLPSDLLARRPDIIAAEYRILEAYNRVGEAQAARFPSFSLTASGGFASTALFSLLSGGLTMGLAPKIDLPVFDAGRRKAKVEANKARAQIAEDTYRKTVMTAFEEVENALVNLASRKEQKKILKEKAASLWHVRKASLQKLEMGLISQLEVLDVERELFQSERSLVQMDRNLYDDTITLYKALGGGWPRVTVK